MPTAPLQKFGASSGLDVAGSDVDKEKSYLTVALNAQYNRNNHGIEKRPGYQARISSQGGFGTFDYNQIDKDTGVTTVEYLTADTRLRRRASTTFAIGYSGSADATFSIFLNSGGTAFQFVAYVDGTAVLTYALGTGFDETSTITLSNLKTQIDAISGGAWSATITGTTSLPAAFLPAQKTTEAPATLYCYSWETVNSPLTTLFQGSYDNRNASDFENISSAQVNGCIYFANGYDETTKYDGHTHYRAGLPQLVEPTLTVAASGGGTAQVQTVLCRAEAAVAEVQDITCVADSSVAQVATFEFTRDNRSNYRDDFVIFQGWNGTIIETVCAWFKVLSSDTAPAAGADRYLEIDLTSTGPTPGAAVIAEVFKVAVNADSAWAASRSSAIVTVTDSFRGARMVPEAWDDVGHKHTIGDSGNVIPAVTTAGGDGLNQKYFIIYDTAGSVAVWFDLIGGAAAPVHGANRAIEVTAASFGATASQIASAANTVIDADGQFSSSVLSDVITITNSTAGDVGASNTGTSGFTIAVTTPGLDRLHGKYFILYDSATTNVAFWYDVGNVGLAEPAHGATRGVEISTVTAGMTSAQVATATELLIEADVFASSVATATITATNDTVGLFPAPDAGTSGFTTTITTAGANGGLGAIETFGYALVAKQVDHAGNEYTGEPTALPNTEILTTATTDNVSVRLQSIPPTSGFNTNCAKVNGNQSSTTTITVDTGHTLLVGDTAYFLDRAISEYVEREVTAVAATTVTIAGGAVNVLDNDIMSNNLRIQVLRTKAGGVDLYVAAEVPNNSIDGFTTYIDGKTDNQLISPFLEQIQPHSPPPKGKYIAAWGRQLVIAGKPDAPNEVNLSFIGSDAASSEYYPARYTYLAESRYGDSITGIAQNNEVFAILKDRSIHVASGDPTTASIRVDQLQSGEIGCVAHHSIQQIDGALMWLDDDGVYAMIGGQMPVEISKTIRPLIVGDQGFSTGEYNLRKAVAFNERKLNRNYWLYLPVEAAAPNGDLLSTNESRVLAFNYDRGGWTQWTALPVAGGIAKVGDDVVFTERRFSAYLASTQYNHYFLLRDESEYDYADNKAAISWDVASAWEDLGFPEVEKSWVRLKLFNTEPSFPTTFSLTTSIEVDYLDDYPVSTWNWTVRTDITATSAGRGIPRPFVQRLKGTKSGAARVRFTNSALYECPIINAYSLQYDADSVMEVHD